MKAMPITTPGFWKKDPSVAKNSPTRLWWVSTGPSLAGRGSMMLCQQVNARNNPATKNKGMDQAAGMWGVSPAPSVAGGGSMMLCQKVNARNTPATKNNVMDQATGMLPELVRNVTPVSPLSLGSSWMTAMAGWLDR